MSARHRRLPLPARYRQPFSIEPRCKDKAALYAGVLDPNVRVTSSTLSSIINGGATVMMAVFIDPHMSAMTDDVVEGRVSESQFRKAVVWLTGSRLAGTMLA